MFEIHFLILENTGDGDQFMSSEFQRTVGGRGMADTLPDVAVKSIVTSTGHTQTSLAPHNYPGGSKQKQITLSRTLTETPTTSLGSSTPLWVGAPIFIGRILHQSISIRMLSRPTHCGSLRHRVIRNVRVGYV
jgi:hypothetical protein